MEGPMATCRTCGSAVAATWEELRALIQEQGWNFSDDEWERHVVVHIYHPHCAAANGKFIDMAEWDGNKYTIPNGSKVCWEFYFQGRHQNTVAKSRFSE